MSTANYKPISDKELAELEEVERIAVWSEMNDEIKTRLIVESIRLRRVLRELADSGNKIAIDALDNIKREELTDKISQLSEPLDNAPIDSKASSLKKEIVFTLNSMMSAVDRFDEHALQKLVESRKEICSRNATLSNNRFEQNEISGESYTISISVKDASQFRHEYVDGKWVRCRTPLLKE
jgi:hypothetical protein